MLIESYKLEIEVADHSAEVFEYEAIAHLPVDIREVLPYLNASLKSGTYYTDGPVFSWRLDEHKVGFWHDRLAADHLESREQAQKVIDQLVKIVNDTWAKRAEITPDNVTHENLQPLELYRLLPKTNCKVCGENTCFNFALKLAAGMVELDKCQTILADDRYVDQLKQLESLLLVKRPLL
ncbi:MAG: (Fe-S)-binding protein [Desulfomonilaceae bacterium]